MSVYIINCHLYISKFGVINLHMRKYVQLSHKMIFFFDWHSLHERLYSYYEAWSYKKKKYKKFKTYRKSVWKEPTVKSVNSRLKAI